MNESGKMKNDTLPNKNILVNCPNMSENSKMKNDILPIEISW